MKRAALLLTTLLAALALGASAHVKEAEGAGGPKVPASWTFSFPDGDPAAGQVVFMRMECYSCHSISIPGATLPSETGEIGPDLTPGYAELPREYLAESIIKAHTVVAAPGYEVKSGKASMGNYNHFMTIQELIDLVAFLQQLPRKPGQGSTSTGPTS